LKSSIFVKWLNGQMGKSDPQATNSSPDGLRSRRRRENHAGGGYIEELLSRKLEKLETRKCFYSLFFSFGAALG
jgi:hypothetical protein